MRELGEDRTRAQVALLSQEVHVFSGPLVDDVRPARPDADDSEVANALERVGALGWVHALPDGVDTVVGESGHQLTGAQARQVAFARLVLADPPIAVLDEATAEAGSAGARELERASVAATEGRTTLVVAHRLTQAQQADRIVVLDHGRVVESGTHGRCWPTVSGMPSCGTAGRVLVSQRRQQSERDQPVRRHEVAFGHCRQDSLDLTVGTGP